jgi:hypothetical protein
MLRICCKSCHSFSRAKNALGSVPSTSIDPVQRRHPGQTALPGDPPTSTELTAGATLPKMPPPVPAITFCCATTVVKLIWSTHAPDHTCGREGQSAYAAVEAMHGAGGRWALLQGAASGGEGQKKSWLALIAET